MFLLSLDEMERVKGANNLPTFASLEEKTHVSERTWRTAFKSRRPTPAVLDALGGLGARPDRILIWQEPSQVVRAGAVRQAVSA
ncbi:transcriptional regulator [Gordonia iterans]|uniref:Transcriptional regulator n=1 Tax=Gordonia iterans TaxID=1004901 RepID=A0A2S0KB49_9ACTN|nr:transcriptional regulator [Gordonia iterans]